MEKKDINVAKGKLSREKRTVFLAKVTYTSHRAVVAING